MTVDRVSSGRHHTLAELTERRKFSETLEDTSLEVAQLIHLGFSNGIPDQLVGYGSANFALERLIDPRVQNDRKQGALNGSGSGVGTRNSVPG